MILTEFKMRMYVIFRGFAVLGRGKNKFMELCKLYLELSTEKQQRDDCTNHFSEFWTRKKSINHPISK
jgi:hypothetical protein